jgi:hypothetical protein
MNTIRQFFPLRLNVMPVESSRASVQSGWLNLNTLNGYISWLKERSVGANPYRAMVYGVPDYLWAPFWSEVPQAEWATGLRTPPKPDTWESTVYVLGGTVPLLPSFELEDAPLSVAKLFRAYIARLVHSMPSSGGLRWANAAKSALARFLATAFQFRKEIRLQRRYYLIHGSHPIENSIRLRGRSSPRIRGCAMAFQA